MLSLYSLNSVGMKEEKTAQERKKQFVLAFDFESSDL